MRSCLNAGGEMTVARPAGSTTSAPPDCNVTKLVPEDEGSTAKVTPVDVSVAGVKMVIAYASPMSLIVFDVLAPLAMVAVGNPTVTKAILYIQ